MYINLHLKITKLLNEIEIKKYLYFRIGSYLVTFHKCNILCVFNNQILCILYFMYMKGCYCPHLLVIKTN